MVVAGSTLPVMNNFSDRPTHQLPMTVTRIRHDDGGGGDRASVSVQPDPGAWPWVSLTVGNRVLALDPEEAAQLGLGLRVAARIADNALGGGLVDLTGVER